MENELWPWETGAADWARRRRKNKNARSKPTIEIERDAGQNRRRETAISKEQNNNTPQPSSHHIQKPVVVHQKKRKAPGKFDKLVETRKELQASMNRVNATAETWEADAKVFDERASAIGGEGQVIAEIGKALGETEELRQRETLMLGDLAVWLERVRDMPREMFELEIEDSLMERLETMQETANGFEDSNNTRAVALQQAIEKFSAQSSIERNAALKANKMAKESHEALLEAVEVATKKTQEAAALSTELLSCKEKHTELLKNHKTFVAHSKAEAEHTRVENGDIIRAKDMRIAQLEGKLRNVEQLDRALMGDSDLVDRLEELEKESVEKEFEVIGLKRTVVEHDVTISTLRLQCQQLKNELDRSGGAENGKLREKLEKMTTDNKNAFQRINDLEAAESSLYSQLSELKDTIRHLESEKQSMLHEKEKFQDEIMNLKKSIDRLNKLKYELVDTKEKLNQAKKDQAALTEKLTAEFETKMKDLRNEVASLKETVEELTIKQDDLEEQVKREQAKIDSLKAQLEAKGEDLSDCQKKLSEEQQLTAELRQKIKAMEDNFDTSDLEAQIAEGLAKLQESEELVESLRKQIASLEAEVNDHSHMDATVKKLEEAQDRIKQLELELHDNKNALDAATAQGGNVADLQHKLEMALLNLQEKTNEVNRISRLNTKFTTQLVETQKLAQDKTAENGTLKAKISELKTIIAHTVKMTKEMDPKAVRNKETRASLMNMVVQYDKFENKGKAKDKLKESFIKRMSIHNLENNTDLAPRPQSQESDDPEEDEEDEEGRTKEEEFVINESEEEVEEEVEEGEEEEVVKVKKIKKVKKKKVNVTEVEEVIEVEEDIEEEDQHEIEEIAKEVEDMFVEVEVEEMAKEPELEEEIIDETSPVKPLTLDLDDQEEEKLEEEVTDQEEEVVEEEEKKEEQQEQKVEEKEQKSSSLPMLRNKTPPKAKKAVKEEDYDDDDDDDDDEPSDSFKSPMFSKSLSFAEVSEDHPMPTTSQMVIKTSYDQSKFLGQPSPRIQVLKDFEKDSDEALKTAEEIEQRLEELRERYYLLSGMWLDVKLDGSRLTRGTVALAKEYEWRVKGRPIDTIGNAINDAVSNVVDVESLRQVSYGIATLRVIEIEISDRISWAIIHPPCHTPGCKNKAVLIAGSNGPSICTMCKAEQSLLKGTRGGKTLKMGIDTDLEQLERIRNDALKQQTVLQECLGMFDVDSAAALRRQVEKEAEQLKVLLSWRSLVKGKGKPASERISADKADEDQGIMESERRLHILEAQIQVLVDFIETSGGWRAAVVIGPGYVNVDANLEYWHVEEKAAMLEEMVKFLKSSLTAEHEDKLSIIDQNESKTQKLLNEIDEKKKYIEELEKRPLEAPAPAPAPAPVILSDEDPRITNLKLQLEKQTGVAQGLQKALERFIEDLKPHLEAAEEEVVAAEQSVLKRRKSMDEEEDEDELDGLFDDQDIRYPNYDVAYVRRIKTKEKKQEDIAEADEDSLKDESVEPEPEPELEEEDEVWALKRAALVAGGESETVIAMEKSLYLIENDGERVFANVKEVADSAKKRAVNLELELEIMTDACISLKKQIGVLEKLYSKFMGSRSENMRKVNSRQSSRGGIMKSNPVDKGPLLYHEIKSVDDVGGVSGLLRDISSKGSSRGGLVSGGSSGVGGGSFDGAAAADAIIEGLKEELTERDQDIMRYLSMLKVFGIPLTSEFGNEHEGNVHHDGTPLLGSAFVIRNKSGERRNSMSSPMISSQAEAMSRTASQAEDNDPSPSKTYNGSEDNNVTPKTNKRQSISSDMSDKKSPSADEMITGNDRKTHPIGCLEELEQMVVHDKLVVELLNALLFQKVEAQLKLDMATKKMGAYSTLARTAANNRPSSASQILKGNASKTSAVASGDPLMVSGSMVPLGKSKSLMIPTGGGGLTDGLKSLIDVDEVDDEHAELEKTMLALHHYISVCEKARIRIQERIDEVQAEHNRCVVTMKERFQRVEVCTQWIFSGMSHRLFLEWGRQWKDDLELARKTRKEMIAAENAKNNALKIQIGGASDSSGNNSGYCSKNTSIPGTPDGMGAGRLGGTSGLAALFHAGGVYSNSGSNTNAPPSDSEDENIMVNPLQPGRMKVRTPTRTPPLGLYGCDLGGLKMGVLNDIQALRSNPSGGSKGNSRSSSRQGSKQSSRRGSKIPGSRAPSAGGGNNDMNSISNQFPVRSNIKVDLSVKIENDNGQKDSRPSTAQIDLGNPTEKDLDGDWSDPDGWITIKNKNKNDSTLQNAARMMTPPLSTPPPPNNKFATSTTGNYRSEFGSSWAINQPKTNKSQNRRIADHQNSVNEEVSFPKIKGGYNNEGSTQFPWRPELIKTSKDKLYPPPHKNKNDDSSTIASPSDYFRKYKNIEDQNSLNDQGSNDSPTGDSFDGAAGLRLTKQSLSAAGAIWSAKMDPNPNNKRSTKPTSTMKYI